MNKQQKRWAKLDNPFVFNDGRPVGSPSDWDARRNELRTAIVETEYGGLPPVAGVHAEPLHTHRPQRLPGVTFTQYRIVLDDAPQFHFRLDLLLPESESPVPCVLTGDACWRYVDDCVADDVLGRGMALAQFSRTEIAPDIYSNDRDTALYRVYPDLRFGALAAWAWGYHRCVDALSAMAEIEEIAVVGHSRGGKASLLAGATDDRITVTCANDSGCGGAGSFKCEGPEAETIADLHRAISYWFGPALWEYEGREADLPFDQHFLKALVAPRAFLSTEALGDLWTNPSGTYQTYGAAREVYRFLGAEEKIGIWYREGGHSHGHSDWSAFLDFVEWQLRGNHPTHNFAPNPFPEMGWAFDWAAPC